jgi:ketosteroid isomerase-like protein
MAANRRYIPHYRIFLLLLCLAMVAFAHAPADRPNDRKQIGAMLDTWHAAAAKADFNGYFKLMADNSVFIGTDATENWNKKAFMAFAKPYFDRGRAWSFTALERHIFFDASGKTAWFDELLNTQMKICRGSGVVTKEKDGWKIRHYVLSMTIPNDLVDKVVPMKAPAEDSIINKLKQ